MVKEFVKTDTFKEDGSPKWFVNEYLDAAGKKVYLKKDDKEIPANVPALSVKAQLIEDILKGIKSKIGGDSTTDLARLLRVPGTLNRKNERNGREPIPCTLYQIAADRRYSIDQFRPLADASPDRGKREAVKKVKLKRPRKLTEAKENKLNELLLVRDTETVGNRSEADFSLCCYAVEHAISRDDVWRLAQTVGKFASDGERYFDRTWKKAETRTREKIYDKTVGKKQKSEKTKFTVIDQGGEQEGFALTDTGLAERFASRNAARFRYCHPQGKWYHYDDKRWNQDCMGAVDQAGKETARSIYGEAANEEDDEKCDALVSFARASESAAKRAAMVKLAQSEPGIPGTA